MPGWMQRFLGSTPDTTTRRVAAAWAKQGHHKIAATTEGYAIDSREGGAFRWRMEWAAAQRHYINGKELRVRAELTTGADMRLMLISRELMATLEQALFDRSIEGNQTYIDEDLPPEMRWLVLFPKVPRSVLGDLRDQFGFVASPPRAAGLWLTLDLMLQLKSASEWLPAGTPFTLTVQRGRVTLRAGLSTPTAQQLDGALALLTEARSSALAVAQKMTAGEVGDDLPTSWGGLKS